MPIPSPFHPCIAPLCESNAWRDWSGYLAPARYGYSFEREYYAIRTSAAVIDVSPLFKYEIQGPDAAILVDRLVPRDVARCGVGRVLYSPWCDDRGHVVDDGTIQRLAPDRFRITAADPSFRWFEDCSLDLDARVRNVSGRLAGLALQGPLSRQILSDLVEDIDLAGLRYFQVAQARIGGIPATISRTGYTGDLGYELWVPVERAAALWELLMDHGRGYGLTPAGLAALDIARIEAGLLLIDVDYISAQKARIEAQKSTPYELGLGWTVARKSGFYIGKPALEEARVASPTWSLVGLEVDWNSLEQLYQEVDLPAHIGIGASRSPVPLYSRGVQIGQATSSAFSPLLKRMIALASVRSEYGEPGAELDYEVTVEYRRRRARARVVALPFYDPPQKRA